MIVRGLTKMLSTFAAVPMILPHGVVFDYGTIMSHRFAVVPMILQLITWCCLWKWHSNVPTAEHLQNVVSSWTVTLAMRFSPTIIIGLLRIESLLLSTNVLTSVTKTRQNETCDSRQGNEGQASKRDRTVILKASLRDNPLPPVWTDLVSNG